MNFISNDAERVLHKVLARYLEIEVLLTSFNNIYIISFEKLHEEAVDDKVKRQ